MDGDYNIKIFLLLSQEALIAVYFIFHFHVIPLFTMKKYVYNIFRKFPCAI